MSHDHEDFDWDAMAAQLERDAEIHRPVYAGAASWLRTLIDGKVERLMDVGGGPGVVASTLAEEFTEASVQVVDGATGLLDRAVHRAAALGLGDRFTVRQADLPAGLDDLEPADLVWSSQFVHHLGDQQAGLNRLAGLLRPGGLLAVLERGLPQRSLPRDIRVGRPGLETRLDSLLEERFIDMRSGLDGTVDIVEDWPAMITEAGLKHTGSRTFLVDLPSPVDTPVREHLVHRLSRFRDLLAERMATEDLSTVEQLLDPESPQGLLRRPDVYYLAAFTVHTGQRG
ncbi:class I SAM-dependent methyltransferase [Pseudonocardiaceae bacterium YIM PH 21723]|nr:class I SAM-dependent methyltransferase [Pseudonocardiaceae bacterium YIM PH 21723]